MPNIPTLGVNVAVIQNDQILLTRREDFEVWCLPSGAVEAGESIAQAAIRETLEETGIEVQLTRLVGVYSRLGPFNDTHAVLFVAQPTGGALRTQPGETIELGWFRQDEIPGETMVWFHQRIADAFNGVGNGVAWSQKYGPSLADLVTSRQALYDLRDASGLSRQEFYYALWEKIEMEENVRELGEADTGTN